VDERSYRYVYDHVRAPLAGAVVARSVAAAFGLYELAVGVGFEGLEVFGSTQYHRSAIPTATAVRAAARLVLLAVERDAAIAPATRTNDEPGFIYKLQRS
jgi:hypothetical protein